MDQAETSEGERGQEIDLSAPAPRLYRGKSAEEREAERRTRLLAAALEKFGTVGYSSTTINELCSRAGVTTKDFYKIFSSREELLLELSQQIGSDLEAAVDRTIAAAFEKDPTDVVGMIRAGLDTYIHSSIDDPRLARVIFLEVFQIAGGLEAAQKIVNVFVALIGRYAHLLEGLGQLPRSYTELEIVALAGGIREIVLALVLSDGEGITVDEAVTVGANLWIRAIGLSARTPG